MERSLVLVKPDAMQRGLASEVLGRIERRGLKIVAMRLLQMDEEMAKRHYAEHVGKPFFAGLVAFITSCPIIAAVFEGENAVALVRQTMGATDPAKAAPGTIRGDLGIDLGRNLVHGSDSPQSAEREVALFFDKSEIVGYERSLEPWIKEA
ncbi:MAG: nucleoside-diphosphate kinase [Dehalococcoidia bacterium]|nr:nucleoside-diphosphate kinase [Dehalococcoidia bacterium]